MSETSSYSADDGVYEQLVAYLDGELDAESSLEVERRLAADESFRRELQQLQRAWDMLDELPKSELSDSFTQTTVEMVVLSAEQELEQQKSRVHWQRRVWWLAGAVSLVVASLVGFWTLAALLARPNEQMVRDLPVIENVDLYRVAESADYLRELHDSGLFAEEIDDAL